MIALLCGSRGWHDSKPVDRVLTDLKREADERGETLTVVHGAAPGLDRMAGRLARNLGCEVISVPAEWDRYGKGAGPIRNQKMLDEYQPEVVWAFRATGKSRGTHDMIGRAKAAGVPTHVVWGSEG